MSPYSHTLESMLSKKQFLSAACQFLPSRWSRLETSRNLQFGLRSLLLSWTFNLLRQQQEGDNLSMKLWQWLWKFQHQPRLMLTQKLYCLKQSTKNLLAKTRRCLPHNRLGSTWLLLLCLGMGLSVLLLELQLSGRSYYSQFRRRNLSCSIDARLEYRIKSLQFSHFRLPSQLLYKFQLTYCLWGCCR